MQTDPLDCLELHSVGFTKIYIVQEDKTKSKLLTLPSIGKCYQKQNKAFP